MAALTIPAAAQAARTTAVDATAGFGLSCCCLCATETTVADATMDADATTDAEVCSAATAADANGLSGSC